MPTSAARLTALLGSRKDPHTGVCFIECESLIAFRRFFSKIRNVDSDPPPREGGLVNQEIAIRLPSGEEFFAVSYRDEGMAGLIARFAEYNGVRSARVEQEEFLVSDRQRLKLASCDLIRDQSSSAAAISVHLTIQPCGPDEWTFGVAFQNQSDCSASVPMDAIRRSGDRVELRFGRNGETLQPVSFTIAIPRERPREVDLPPGQRAGLEFSARLEPRGANVCLCFRHAEYKVERGSTYEVAFAWQDMTSNTVRWQPT